MNEFAVLAQLTVVAMVPYLLASLGTMLGGLTGVFSVSQEGVMLLGASVGFLISYNTGSTALGILLAAAVGAVFGFALGWATTALRLDQYIAAVALFFATMDVVALRAEVSGIDIPSQVLLVIPYVATLIVMVFAFRWARVPEFLGRNYDRESRTG